MEVMKQITEEEILNSRFCRVHENLAKITAKIPSYKEAKGLDYRTLCIVVGILGLRFRDLPGSVKNANFWLKKGAKKDLLNLFKDEFM